MKIERLSERTDFLSDAHSRFGTVWSIQLEAGETTDPHQIAELEEMYCFVRGTGELMVDEQRVPVKSGEVIHVPRQASRWLKNSSNSRLCCLTVERGQPSLEEECADTAVVDTLANYRETLSELEQAVQATPEKLSRVEAIQQIVILFDVAGRLAEFIEHAFGLDSEEGVEALSAVEKRIMDAVVDVTRGYQRGDRDLGLKGLDLQGFGGRMSSL